MCLKTVASPWRIHCVRPIAQEGTQHWCGVWYCFGVLCGPLLRGSASRACPLCHSVSQDCGFSLEDPLHETHCIGGHSTLVSVRYCFADCSTIQDCLLNKATLGFWCLAPFIFAGSCLKQCHVGMMRGIIDMMIWGFL